MKQYLENLTHILNNGVECEDRTGTGTLSVFGTQLRFDLSEGFPLLTTKKLHIKSIFCELLWFLKGSTNAESLQQMSVRIWNEWALKEDVTEEVLMSPPDRLQYAVKHNKFVGTEEQLRKILNVKGENLGMIYLDTLGVPRTRTVVLRKKGDLGPIYGKQWRKWSSRDPEQNYRIIDQVAEVIESIKTNPYSRRHIVTAWNVADLDKMALPPCHLMFQFYVRNGKLSCHLLMRSQDYFLGVPYNIASYALLTHMIAMVTNLEVGELLINGVDSHIYVDHIEQVKEQLTREVRPLPKLVIKRKVDNIDDFTLEDFEVVDYDPHPHIAGKVSV